MKITGNHAFSFAPSLLHRHLMDSMEQTFAWRGGEVSAWQRRFRRELRKLIGEMPENRIPLNVRSLWKREHSLGSIEKIVFASEPYADVPAYVCLPGKVKPPYTFMLCLQGHSTGMHNSIGVDRRYEKKPLRVSGNRDFALGCMSNGIAALCIEQRSFGYREETVQKRVSPHGCHDATMHALMLGRTLLGERVFDVDRGIDYLETRNDVDFRTLGVMGNSGGGTVSIFSAALLPRLRLAMPSCSFCTFKDSTMSIYHCADNYVPGLYCRGEMADVLGLFAPRPVVIVAGEKDRIFPIRGVLKAYQKLKAIYRALDAEEHCHLLVGSGGHRFYARIAWPKVLSEFHRLQRW